MNASLNEIKQTEHFLSGKMKAEDSLLFRAKLILDPVLRRKVSAQQKTYSLVRLYGRKKLKSELDTIHHQIFNDPDKALYRQKISQLFSKS